MCALRDGILRVRQPCDQACKLVSVIMLALTRLVIKKIAGQVV